MRCPSCGADMVDEKAAFCSRCGAPLGSSETEATDSLDVADLDKPPTGNLEIADEEVPSTGGLLFGHPEGGDDADEVDLAAETSAARPLPALAPESSEGEAQVASDSTEDSGRPTEGGGTAERSARRRSRSLPVGDMATALRRAFVSGGWPDAASSAGFAMLCVLGAGAVIVVAAKLDSPDLGAGASPVAVFTAIVMLGLACLGVPLSIGDLSLAALPLGLLAVLALALSWTGAAFVVRREVSDLRQRAFEGAKIGIPLALYCFIAALAFQIRNGPTHVAASPFAALMLGLLWGTLFGAFGGVRTALSLKAAALGAVGLIRRRRPSSYQGVVAGLIMLVVTAVMATGGLFLWIIVGLATGHPARGVLVGDAVAALVYFVAFLPNLLGLVAAFAVGAPVDIGARVTFGGRAFGHIESFSIFGHRPGALALLLVIIPVVAGVLGGYSARRNAKAPKDVLEVLGVAAGTYAVVLAVTTFLGAVRVGAGVIGRGVGRLAPNPYLTLAAAFLWAAVMGFAGWKVAERWGHDAGAGGSDA